MSNAISIEEIETRLRDNPEDTVAVNAVNGTVKQWLEQNNYYPARDLLQRILPVAPDNWQFLYNMGVVCQHFPDADILQRAQFAFEYYKKVLALKPDFHPAINNFALVLSTMGQHEQARSILEKLIKQQPDFIAARFALGREYGITGEFEKAEEQYNLVLEQEPQHTKALFELSVLHKAKANDDPLFAKLEAARRIVTEDNAKNEIAFSLGKLYSDVKDYDHAWKEWQTANNLMPAAKEAFMETFRKERDCVTSEWTEEFFAQHAESGDKASRHIFIIGMPRCGSSLTERMLAAHPEVAGAGELLYLFDITRQVPTLYQQLTKEKPKDHYIYPFHKEMFTPEVIKLCAKAYTDQLQRHIPSGKRYFVNKAMGNYMQAGLIALMFPNARLIHCLRHPIDTILSMYAQKFDDNQPFSTRVEQLAEAYDIYLDIMAHWKKVLPVPMHTVRYEEMVADQEAVTRSLFDFLELEAPEDIENLHMQASNTISTASRWQARQPIYKTSQEKWRHYERHLQPWIGDLQALVEKQSKLP